MRIENGAHSSPDRDAEHQRVLQDSVLDLVYGRIPEEDFAYANHSIAVLKLRRDTIRLAAPQMGMQAKQMWEDDVVPAVTEEHGKIVIPIETLRLAYERLSISEFEDIEHPDRFSLGFAEQHKFSLDDMERIAFLPKSERNLLIGFYLHDRYYAYPRSQLMGRLLTQGEKVMDETGKEIAVKIFPQDFEHMRDFANNFEGLVGLSRFPHDFFAAIIQQNINERVDAVLNEIQSSDQQYLSELFKGDKELQEQTLQQVRNKLTAEIDEEDIDVVHDIVLPIARLLRMRYVEHDYAFGLDKESENDSNSIWAKVPLRSQFLRMNYGMLTSIVYNLAKNAVKATDYDMRTRAGKEDMYERYPFIVRYGSKSTDHGNATSKEPLVGYSIGFEVKGSKKNIILTISDTGIGLKTDEIMQTAAGIIRNTPDAVSRLASAFIDKNTIRVLTHWANGEDFAARMLQLGEVWDLLGLPRLSGFDAAGITESSGMGLWGIGYMVAKKNGTLAITNRFGKGASFRVALPNHR